MSINPRARIDTGHRIDRLTRGMLVSPTRWSACACIDPRARTRGMMNKTYEPDDGTGIDTRARLRAHGMRCAASPAPGRSGAGPHPHGMLSSARLRGSAPSVGAQARAPGIWALPPMRMVLARIGPRAPGMARMTRHIPPRRGNCPPPRRARERHLAAQRMAARGCDSRPIPRLVPRLHLPLVPAGMHAGGRVVPLRKVV